MRVLFVNHTSRMSGAERSLLALASRIGSHSEVMLAAPAGELLRRAERDGIPTAVIEPPPLSFRTGLRTLVADSAGFVRTGLRLRALARSFRADVVHAGSGRAGLLALPVRFGGGRLVVDIRDVLPRRAKAHLVRRLLRWSAHVLVFNSAYTQRAFGPTWPARALVCRPAVDVSTLLQRPLVSSTRTSTTPTLGVVGQITPWKGLDDAVRVLALVRGSHPGTRLRIIGSVVFPTSEATFDNERYAASLHALAEELDVADGVDFAGATEDIEAALASLDVLLVPSWEEPFGRVVTEAMAAGVPVVATCRGGPAEQIEDGVTGFLVEPRRPEAWVGPVCNLLGDAELRFRMANQARRRVAASDPSSAVRRLEKLYESLVLTRGRVLTASTVTDSC